MLAVFHANIDGVDVAYEILSEASFFLASSNQRFCNSKPTAGWCEVCDG